MVVVTYDCKLLVAKRFYSLSDNKNSLQIRLAILVANYWSLGFHQFIYNICFPVSLNCSHLSIARSIYLYIEV